MLKLIKTQLQVNSSPQLARAWGAENFPEKNYNFFLFLTRKRDVCLFYDEFGAKARRRSGKRTRNDWHGKSYESKKERNKRNCKTVVSLSRRRRSWKGFHFNVCTSSSIVRDAYNSTSRSAFFSHSLARCKFQLTTKLTLPLPCRRRVHMHIIWRGWLLSFDLKGEISFSFCLRFSFTFITTE